jgi:hypothetical protein
MNLRRLRNRAINAGYDLLRWLNADDERHVFAVCACVLAIGLTLGITAKTQDNPSNYLPRSSAVRG